MREPYIRPSHIVALLKRFYLEYKRIGKAFVVGDTMERILFFTAFGFGLGAAVRMAGDVPYLSFIAPGIAASTGVFVMTMAMTYGVYERYSRSGVWQSWLATPIKLQEILLSELLYASLRSLPSTLILFAVAAGFGALPHWGYALATLPILFLANLVYGAIALIFSSYATRILYFMYVKSLWLMPMYLFSGVFYDLETTPQAMQWFASIFPLTHVMDVVRPMMVDGVVPWAELATMLAVLSVMFVVIFAFVARNFKKRLFD